MFPGQGTQFTGMAASLYETEPVFREHLGRCVDVLRRRSNIDIEPALLDRTAGVAGEMPPMATATAQPALFSVEYALAKLWMHWGVIPDAMLGHSIGEYVAACLAGVFSVDDALWLVAERGRLMQAAAPGSMLAVGVAERDVQPLLDADLSIAAVNALNQCVLSGPVASIDRVVEALRHRGIFGVRLHTSHAFHSAMMNAAIEPFEAAVRAVSPRTPSLPFLSNVTGDWITNQEATDPEYWGRQLRSTVRFSDCLRNVFGGADGTLIAVGPGTTLGSLARQHDSLRSSVIVDSMPGARDEECHQAHLLDAAARVWSGGATVDWSAFFGGERRSRVALPTYPFERKRYWIDPPAHSVSSARTLTSAGRDPDVANWFYAARWTESELDDAGPAASGRRRCVVFDDGVVGIHGGTGARTAWTRGHLRATGRRGRQNLGFHVRGPTA